MFYRLSPKKARRLSGPEYFALCYRTPAYAGAMQSQVAAQEEEDRQAQEENVVAPTRAALSTDPAFAGMIDWG